MDSREDDALEKAETEPISALLLSLKGRVRRACGGAAGGAPCSPTIRASSRCPVDDLEEAGRRRIEREFRRRRPRAAGVN